jgi:hypothetical protein
MAIQDPSKWAGSWGTGVGRSGDKWATQYVAAGPAIFQKAAAAVGDWQAAVSSQMAADAFTRGLNAVNFAQVQATVTGAGKTKYTSSGSTKQAKYAAFAQIFGPKLQMIVTNLPPRGPRGSAQNRTRLNQLLDAVQATRGTN